MRRSLFCLFLPLLAAFSPPALAALTTVSASGNGNGAERCLAGVSCPDGVYAGAVSIVRAFEIDLGLAAGTLQRVDDAADREWMTVAANAALRPMVRYAGDNSQLGVTSGAGAALLGPVLGNATVAVDHPGLFAGGVRGGEFTLNTNPWLSIPVAAGTPFAFLLKDLSASLQLVSDTALAGFSNSGYAQDWMVTWRVPGQNMYLIAWEDRRNIGANGLPNDYDYNDYVAVVRGVTTLGMMGQGDPVPTPLPAGAGLMLAGLGLLGGAARRRSARP